MRRWTEHLHRPVWPALLAAVLLAGCSGSPPRDDGHTPVTPRQIDPDHIADAVPRVEPRSRYGNPSSYQVFGRTYRVMNDAHGFVERGIASWYGPNFHGKRTSSGEPYDMYKMTAAHKHLPIPCYVRVTNLENGRQAVVRVNDRGPFHDGRIIDLSYSAAVKLGVVRSGTARVEIRVIDPRHPVDSPAPAPAAPVNRLADNSPGSHGDIYLQAGAFASQVNAEMLNRRLQSALSEAVAVRTSPDPARPLYRVRLGPLDSVEEAMRLASELDRLGVTGARVVID